MHEGEKKKKTPTGLYMLKKKINPRAQNRYQKKIKNKT